MAFRDCHGELDVDSLTTCITDYTNFHVDNTVPVKRLQCLSNYKPCVNPELKLNEKKRVLRTGDKEELRKVQKELKWEIRKESTSSGENWSGVFLGNHAREVYRGVKISGRSKDK